MAMPWDRTHSVKSTQSAFPPGTSLAKRWSWSPTTKDQPGRADGSAVMGDTKLACRNGGRTWTGVRIVDVRRSIASDGNRTDPRVRNDNITKSDRCWPASAAGRMGGWSTSKRQCRADHQREQSLLLLRWTTLNDQTGGDAGVGRMNTSGKNKLNPSSAGRQGTLVLNRSVLSFLGSKSAS